MNRLTKKFSIMGRKYDLAYGQANTWKRKLKNDKYELIEDAIDKLGQLEDIEEELGIDLATFIKIFENGIYVKSQCTNNKIERWSPFDIKVIKSTYQTDICYIRSKKNKYVGCFNYGKTWALTKKELENDK